MATRVERLNTTIYRNPLSHGVYSILASYFKYQRSKSSAHFCVVPVIDVIPDVSSRPNDMHELLKLLIIHISILPAVMTVS